MAFDLYAAIPIPEYKVLFDGNYGEGLDSTDLEQLHHIREIVKFVKQNS